MGLMDILNGMQNGPRGQRQPQSASGSGGMSPMTMALIGLLAYKALKSGGILGGGQPGAAPPPAPGSSTTPAGNTGGLGGILGSILGGASAGGVSAGQAGGSPTGGLGGMLGGLIASGAAGSVLSGGLGNLMKDLQNSGHAGVAQSWIGSGANKSISPDDLAHALGADAINALSAQSGLDRDELLHGLSQQLPELVDKLTPEGRIPTEHEAARMV